MDRKELGSKQGCVALAGPKQIGARSRLEINSDCLSAGNKVRAVNRLEQRPCCIAVVLTCRFAVSIAKIRVRYHPGVESIIKSAGRR